MNLHLIRQLRKQLEINFLLESGIFVMLPLVLKKDLNVLFQALLYVFHLIELDDGPEELCQIVAVIKACVELVERN